jgi:pimeloyl-ACP methyl ester carboxylesterase
MEDKLRTSINIVFVHGTFARNASWTHDGSLIHKYLSCIKTYDNCVVNIHSAVWSGKNSRSARKDGAEEIKLKVEQLDTVGADPHVYLVGHSHGGSAIAYFLKKYPSLSGRVAGTAFLSTPFIGLRVRPTAHVIYLLGFGCFLFGARIDQYSANRCFISREFFRSAFGTRLSAAYIKYSYCGLRDEENLAINHMGSWQKLERTLSMGIDETETANIPFGNYLFVRATRDEAAALLASTQFLAWSTSLAAYLAGKIVIYAYDLWNSLERNRIGQTLKVTIFIMFGLWATFLPIWLISGHWEYLWAFFISDFSVEFGLGSVDKLVDVIFWIIWPLCNVILAIAIIFVFSTTFLIMVGSLALIVFGWVSLTEAVFADLAIEPIPYGEYKLFHLGWHASYTSDKFVLDHSLTYEHPYVASIHWRMDR